MNNAPSRANYAERLNLNAITATAPVVQRFEPVLLAKSASPKARRSRAYEAAGGYQALRKALKEMTPAQVIEMVKVQRTARPRRGGLSRPG